MNVNYPDGGGVNDFFVNISIVKEKKLQFSFLCR